MVSQNSCRKGASKSNKQKLHSPEKALYHPLLTELRTSIPQNAKLLLFQKKPELKPQSCSSPLTTRPNPPHPAQTHVARGRASALPLLPASPALGFHPRGARVYPAPFKISLQARPGDRELQPGCWAAPGCSLPAAGPRRALPSLVTLCS